MTSADPAPQQPETQPAPVVHTNAHAPKAAGALRLATVNVNGLRAAHRKGMGTWFAGRGVDVLTLQEVRAPKEIVEDLLEDITGQDWHVVETAAAAKGRAGVAIATLLEPQSTRVGIGDPYFDDSGRWIETDLTAPDGKTFDDRRAYRKHLKEVVFSLSGREGEVLHRGRNGTKISGQNVRVGYPCFGTLGCKDSKAPNFPSLPCFSSLPKQTDEPEES